MSASWRQWRLFDLLHTSWQRDQDRAEYMWRYPRDPFTDLPEEIDARDTLYTLLALHRLSFSAAGLG